MSSRLFGRSLVFAAVAALGVAGTAAAGTYSATPPVLLSANPSPYASCTGSDAAGGTIYPNAEVEPGVAVHGSNAIAVWQQDRWSTGGAHGLITAFSTDGGATWNLSSQQPIFSRCAGGNASNGGDYLRASDPWVTIAPDGTAYQISLSVTFGSPSTVSAVLVSSSTDGGDTWSPPTTLLRDDSANFFNDKESITADPYRSGYVYAVWDRSRKPGENESPNAFHSFGIRSDIWFARHTPSGWEDAHPIYAPQANQFEIGDQIVVLPDADHTLVDVFDWCQGSGQQKPKADKCRESVMRSTDAGATWSAPIVIANEEAVPTFDPDTGQSIRSGAGLPDIAVDPSSGDLYAVWNTGMFSGQAIDQVALSRSADGGLTWSKPVKVNLTPTSVPLEDQQAFTPMVDVASDGAVAVSYYDFRDNTSAAGALATAFVAHCHLLCTHAANWSDTEVAGPFDIETAPVARGFFLGDYEGLDHVGSNFLSVFVQANSGNTSNRTDVFASTIG
jgi:hypothetical protein